MGCPTSSVPAGAITMACCWLSNELSVVVFGSIGTLYFDAFTVHLKTTSYGLNQTFKQQLPLLSLH